MKVACVQITSGPLIDENLAHSASFIRKAAEQGAEFISTPENSCHLRYPPAAKLESAFPMETHPAIPYFSTLAKELRITLLIGSIAVKTDNKLWNRSLLFNPQGELQTTYDKIHLFDVQLPSGETHKESDIMKPGTQLATAKINDDFTLGLSICYDLRFAYMYRKLVNAGANILCVPSAFTVSTGKAHWEILLRARAIETGSYVIAAAQVGTHEGGRQTYGHSLIISPWGEVLADGEEQEGFITADINIKNVKTARASIPALQHDREI